MMDLANKHRRSNHIKGEKERMNGEIKEGKYKVVLCLTN
jgi:hypothetical protein